MFTNKYRLKFHPYEQFTNVFCQYRIQVPFSTTGNNDTVCVYSIAHDLWHVMPCPADFGGKFYEDKKV